jgi:hypothetical protein
LNRNPLRRNVQFHEVSVGGLPGAVNLSVSSCRHPGELLKSNPLFTNRRGRD